MAAKHSKAVDPYDTTVPTRKVSLQLVMERSLTAAELVDHDKWDADALFDKARALKTLHLEWQGIGTIAMLDAFEAAEVLYLQYNRIERIEALDCLPKLQFLALQGNRIEAVENLLCLCSLECLDLSRNQIDVLDEDELPQTLNMLNLAENPCTSSTGYRDRLLSRLPKLVYLDGVGLEMQGATDTDDLLAKAEAAEQQKPVFAPSSRGLSAYSKKHELQSDVNNSIQEQIEAYSMEALADCTTFTERAEEAAARSRQRREDLSRTAELGSSARRGRLAGIAEAALEGASDDTGDAAQSAQ